MIRFSTRVVFILPKVVIKIPIDKRGYLQGKNESALYKKYKNTKMLGRLISEFCGVVIMERYKPLGSKLNEDIVKNIYRDFQQSKIISSFFLPLISNLASNINLINLPRLARTLSSCFSSGLS